MQNYSKKSSRQKFTEEEDAKLIALVKLYGAHQWNIIAQSIPNRTGRQCRDRYVNYLVNTLSNGPWTPEEDKFLVEKVIEIGSHWSALMKFFPGRSANNIKNRWYSYHVKTKTKASGLVLNCHNFSNSSNNLGSLSSSMPPTLALSQNNQYSNLNFGLSSNISSNTFKTSESSETRKKLTQKQKELFPMLPFSDQVNGLELYDLSNILLDSAVVNKSLV